MRTKDYLSRRDLARLLGLDGPAVQRFVESEGIPVRRRSGRDVVSVRDWKDYLARTADRELAELRRRR